MVNKVFKYSGYGMLKGNKGCVHAIIEMSKGNLIQERNS